MRGCGGGLFDGFGDFGGFGGCASFGGVCGGTAGDEGECHTKSKERENDLFHFFTFLFCGLTANLAPKVQNSLN